MDTARETHAGSQPSLRLALLGDSVAWGMGASRPDHRLGARLQRGLAGHGVAADVRVLAVPGARTSGLPAQVREARAWGPDIAVVVVGANDLTHLEPVPRVLEDFRRALGGLRESGAEVVVAPAPDLSAVPRVPARLRDLVRGLSGHLRDEQVRVARELGALVADADGATSRAFAADRALFSGDRFHPSSAGYAVIADALLPAVLAAASRPAGR